MKCIRYNQKYEPMVTPKKGRSDAEVIKDIHKRKLDELEHLCGLDPSCLVSEIDIRMLDRSLPISYSQIYLQQDGHCVIINESGWQNKSTFDQSTWVMLSERTEPTALIRVLDQYYKAGNKLAADGGIFGKRVFKLF